MLLAWLFFLALALAAGRAQGQENRLTDIDFVAGAGDRVDVILKLSGKAPEPISFAIDDPARIALDLPNTALALSERSREIGIGLAERISTAQASDRTRVVIQLARLVPYTTRAQGDEIIVSLGATAEAAPAVRQTEDQARQADAAQTQGPVQVTDIDFRRGDRGEGQVIINLSDPNTTMDVQRQGDNTVVTLRNTLIPEPLRQRYDVLDFATPVKEIVARQKGDDAELTVTPSGPYEQLAYQSDQRVTLEFREPVKRQGAEPEEPVYTGAPITLNFQNVETRAVLQILAEVSGRNMVISDSVGGTIALRLQNVPWDQALDIILKSRGLATREIGNVIFVAPAEELAAREKMELEARQQIEQLAPLRSEFIQVNYAKAADIAKLLTGANALLSERGRVSVDERTNTLLVQDTSETLSDVRALVERLDIPVSQVLIESRIVLAQDDFSRDIGVRFGVTAFESFDNDQGLFATSGTLEGTDTAVNESLNSLQNNGTVFPTAVPDENSPRLNVPFPAGGNAASWALAVLGPDYLIDLELSALQAEGKGEVISSPRVITANQKTASIRQGVEIPYQEASASGATSVSFKEAVLKLEVTPQITPDDRVVMDLIVSRDDIGQFVPSGFGGGQIPSIDTREIQTQVLVENGETVVLGGIYEQQTNNQVNKVPLLGDIPVIGRLFKQTLSENDKTELLIFVTPKILKEGLTVQ